MPGLQVGEVWLDPGSRDCVGVGRAAGHLFPGKCQQEATLGMELKPPTFLHCNSLLERFCVVSEKHFILGFPSHGSPGQPLLWVRILGSEAVFEVSAVASAVPSAEDPQSSFVIRQM